MMAETASQNPAGKSRQVGLIAASVAAFVVLVGLGSWQLYRLQWKTALIERIEASAKARPVTINDVEAGAEHGYDVDWLRIAVKGYWRHDLERHVHAIRKKAPGWRILTPLVMPGDYLIWVDRGFVPVNRKSPASRPASQPGPNAAGVAGIPRADWPDPARVTGVVRLYPDRQPLFAPENDGKGNRWYWRDLQGLAASLPENTGLLPPDQPARILPFILQLEPAGAPGMTDLPIVDPVKPSLPNRHLGYALTWYGLAGALVFVAFAFWRSRARRETP